MGLVMASGLGACGTAPRIDTPPVVTSPAEPALVAAGAATRPAVTRTTLDNGLDVYLVPARGAPLVSVQVWVKVGSVDENEGPRLGEGITGLSHFFEHLMFQGTARFPSYDLALAPLGAKNNAFTYRDGTVFWAYTPREHLAHILDIEADRFANLVVDFLHLEPEREVVKSERRQNTDADPGELAEERALKRTFDVFPYRWGPIGWTEDLDAVPLEAAQRYHREHYTTEGAYLVIAGDFEPAAALEAVNATWGKLSRPNKKPAPSELVAKVETWRGERKDHLLRETSEPIVVWTYRAPAPSGATLRDYAALELIDYALTGGKSGRLSRRLVFSETPKVSNLSAWLMPLRHPYAYSWKADLLPGATVAEVMAAVDEEIASIVADGLAPEELQQAVASLRADAVRSHLSPSDKAQTIGMSIASTGAPFALFERLEAYPTITQEEIRAAARRYLDRETRVRVVVVSPTRIAELAQAVAAVRPEAMPVAVHLAKAGGLFVAALDLAHQRAELEREARAIALLKQRADRAIAAATGPIEVVDIKKYSTDNEMGDRARTKRLTAADKELRKREAELVKAQKALLAALKRDAVKTGPGTSVPQVAMAAALATPLNEPIEVTSLVPMPGLTGVERAARAALQSFALEARGMEKTAQELRQAALAACSQLGPLDGDLGALAATVKALLEDGEASGFGLIDRPGPALLPTHERGTP